MRKVLISLVLAVSVSFGSFAVTIFYDNFDANLPRLNGWKESSSTYVTRYTGSYKIGSAAMQLKKSSNAVAYINVSPYKDMRLSFKMAKYSLETGEKLLCQYMTGTKWVTAATLTNTAKSGVYYSYTVSIPTATTLKIRFILNGSATNDYGYVDEVKLIGNRK
ncbi:MAG TPA: hypothetical protein PK385_12185 [Spirochaetota bacterium]|nr:hypothetical protein [Spirochaetota bacterium]HOS33782.1 hypothetical protein [Spirochaetota bacterium]HOS56802.1 hypothetical protein [Spirochaetota bacterium]HPK61882.1 hypothetical protein [Spirochaetota bacterium]HQF79053.1 hypothetical protein [Spirochaetota bacterium]